MLLHLVSSENVLNHVLDAWLVGRIHFRKCFLLVVRVSIPRSYSKFARCQIYVAGIGGSRLEKVRKIINRGGGTRFALVRYL